MATCNAQVLMQEGNCFCGVTVRPFQIAKLALLCEMIKILNPMATCDLPTLMQSAKCFCGVTTNPFEMVELQMLCELRSALSGGISGVTGVDCGTGDPVAAPISGCTLYYRTDNGNLWMWNGSAWILLIGS